MDELDADDPEPDDVVPVGVAAVRLAADAPCVRTVVVVVLDRPVPDGVVVGVERTVVVVVVG